MKHALHNPSSAGHWLHCGLWIHKKLSAEVVPDKPTAAAKRGTKLHELAENALPRLLWEDLDLTQAIAGAKKDMKIRLSKDDDQDLRIALTAAHELLAVGYEEIDFEVEVPLSHEPGSVGNADLVAFSSELDRLMVLDYKFGMVEVDPADSEQLQIYGANLLAKLAGAGFDVRDTEVWLAIVQPALFAEARVARHAATDLLKFQAYVDLTVERQLAGEDKRGADNLAVCDKWCPFKETCSHRNTLINNLVADLGSTELSADQIEHIVRSKSAFEKVLKELSAKVADDPETFPHWKRSVVANRRKWHTVIKADEIAAKLIDAGLKHPYALLSPAAAAAAAPKLTALVNKLSSDQGSHVRLKYVGAAKSENGVEPTKRETVPDKCTKGKKIGKTKN
jgi:hypothetical protein